MKVVLFCGGLGTRLREHSEIIPKPLVEIGRRPIIWHLMQYYASYGHKDFILCLGYRGDLIRNYFLNYNPYITTDFVMTDGGHTLQPSTSDIYDWRISFVDTGIHSNLGQRLVAVREHVKGVKYFLTNYSDQLSDLPLNNFIDKAKSKNSVANFISVKPHQSFHHVEMNENGYVEQLQSSHDSDYWINGGYFIFRSDIFDYIEEGEELVEQPFTRLAKQELIWTQKYDGFWKSMDTFKDKIEFDRMDSRGERPWNNRSHENKDFDHD